MNTPQPNITIKQTLHTHDGYVVSSFLFLLNKRAVLSVPTQIGCINSCSFCISKNAPFQRNLTFDEISKLIELAEIEKHKDLNYPIELSFTGEGEPLYNIKVINQLITHHKILSLFDDFKISFSGKNSALIKKINNKHLINLQFSLHEFDETKRKEIIPLSDSFDEIKNNLKSESNNFKSIQLNYLNSKDLTNQHLVDFNDWILSGASKISFNSLLTESSFTKIEPIHSAFKNIPIKAVYSNTIAEMITDHNFYNDMTHHELKV